MTNQPNPFQLPEDALKVLSWLEAKDATGKGEISISASQLNASLGMGKQQFDDALGRLSDSGVIATKQVPGGLTIEPTHRATVALAGTLDFDPWADIAAVVTALVAQSGPVAPRDLEAKAALDGRRLNLALRYLVEEDLADGEKQSLGDAPYTYRAVVANYKTRDLAAKS